jgi:hypothetical protein
MLVMAAAHLAPWTEGPFPEDAFCNSADGLSTAAGRLPLDSGLGRPVPNFCLARPGLEALGPVQETPVAY